MQPGYDHLEPAELLALARDHNQSAWNALVSRYAPLVWRIALSHHLDPHDAADVCQQTWISLADHLTRIRDANRLPGWLITTARRESVRLRTFNNRAGNPAWWPTNIEETAIERCPELSALRGSRDRLLWRAFAALPQRCQQLLGLWAHAPELSYAQLAAALGIKHRSVGQVRTRCLYSLRRQLAALGVVEGEAG